MLEDSLKERGGKFEKAAENWQSKIVVAGKDGRLITGQNPASAAALGKAVLEALNKL
jgi:putative intracellular protease/amidase